jgi:dihydrofolate synthase/folylpolyglutamate synthase
MRFETLADWLAWQEGLHPRAIDMGLDRVSRVFARMGRGGQLPFTLTVGGTNGKGSCVALLDSILRAQGYRVGTYTSPHILNYNERIRVDGEPVSDARICQAFESIEAARGDISLSFFEFGTLAALDIFADANLDVQVLEVGLGGRLDAVNIVDADAALLVSIDIDHQDWLGHTREAIGLEKAGIFRPGRPAVIGDPDVPVPVLQYAESQGIALKRLGYDFRYAPPTADGWDWESRGARLTGLPRPAIPGEHQLMNAAAVLELLHQVAASRPVSPEAIRAGLNGVKLTGRFQVFPGEVPELLDVAHNPQAVRMLAQHVRREFAGRRVHAVFAVMRDKDIPGIVSGIRDVVDAWYLAPLTIARAATPAELLNVFRAEGVAGVHHGFADLREALARVRHAAQPGDLILVFGTFFLVSEYLAHAT